MPPVILPRSDHSISRKQIDPDALKVLYRLKQAGHVAYLVGGSVRDLLLGRVPKDFDISTSAHPNEVRKLFRNCRLIGRRFRLAHVLFGGTKVIEVATFRRKSEDPPEGEDLLVRRENTFGSPEEDASRRDYTINGLFYDIATFSVIDYVGGLADLAERRLRTIGNPAVRMREDPIRMLRAVKFASRLSFDISPEDLAAIKRFRFELHRAAPERILLEVGRLLGAGHAEPAFRLLDTTGLLEVILPELASHLARARRHPGRAHEDGLWRALSGLDRLIASLRSTPGAAEPPLAVLLGALLTPLYNLAAAPPRPTRSVLRRGFGFAAGHVACVPAVELEGAAPPVQRGEPGPAAPDASLEQAGSQAGEDALPSPAGGPRRSRHRGLARGGAPPSHDLDALLARLAVPRKEADRLRQLFRLQPELRRPPANPGTRRQLAGRPEFEAALQVLQAQALGSQEHQAEVEMWSAYAGRSGGPVLGAVDGARPRRRRARSRSRAGQDGELPPDEASPLFEQDRPDIEPGRTRGEASGRPAETASQEDWAGSTGSPPSGARKRRRRRRRAGHGQPPGNPGRARSPDTPG